MDSGEATRLLRRMGEGDASAGESLLPLVYDELKRLAGALMRSERKDHTLQPTALVHEAWVRVAGSERQGFNDRRHFLAVAAQAMRRLLVDHARARAAEKRGGDWHRVTLSGVSAPEEGVDLVALNEALEQLEEVSPRQARVVELKFFGGFTINEMAEELGVGTTTVEDDWATAKVWLLRALRPS